MSHSPYKEYVIDGAEMVCSFQTAGNSHNGFPINKASGGIILKATDSELIFIQQKAACTEEDKILTGKYKCLATGRQCLPQINSSWKNLRGRAANVKTQDNHFLLLDDALIKCSHGGVLSFIKSGQVSRTKITGDGYLSVPREMRTYVGFTLRQPVLALRIGQFSSGSNNISTIAVLFASNINLTKTDINEGSKINAFRHAIWQAIIANEFGNKVAKEAANAHEVDPLAYEKVLDTEKSGLVVSKLLTLAEADEIIDLKNNIVGRRIGSENINDNNSELAKKILKYYRDKGLSEANEFNETGFYLIQEEKISQEAYSEAIKRIEEGLDKNDKERQNMRG